MCLMCLHGREKVFTVAVANFCFRLVSVRNFLANSTSFRAPFNLRLPIRLNVRPGTGRCRIRVSGHKHDPHHLPVHLAVQILC